MQSGIAYAGTELQAGTATCQVVGHHIPLQEEKTSIQQERQKQNHIWILISWGADGSKAMKLTFVPELLEIGMYIQLMFFFSEKKLM